MKKYAIRALTAALVLSLLPVLALADSFAVVKGGRLNLRQTASTSSQSLGKYATGTWVRVVGNSGSFSEVRTLDGKHGYMLSSYLNVSAGTQSAVVQYANGGYVNLRAGQSLDTSVVMRVTSGTTITILDDTNDWNYVSVNVSGQTIYGYMHNSLISSSAQSATVTTQNGGKVNVRSGPAATYSSVGTLASGTKVTVLLKGNGWYQISANGITGFMATKYLSGTGDTLGTNTGTTTTSSLTAYVNNPVSTQVLNLRETASQSARSIGQYKNGTQVKVVSKGTTWCEVYVGTRHGYMMTRYLSFTSTATTATSTPVYVYVTPTPTPQYVYVTPTPTPQVIYVTPEPTASTETPAAGTKVTLINSSTSSSSVIYTYNDAALTSYKGSYLVGQQVTMLQYGSSVSMVLVDGGVAYVLTANISY